METPVQSYYIHCAINWAALATLPWIVHELVLLWLDLTPWVFCFCLVFLTELGLSSLGTKVPRLHSRTWWVQYSNLQEQWSLARRSHHWRLFLLVYLPWMYWGKSCMLVLRRVRIIGMIQHTSQRSIVSSSLWSIRSKSNAELPHQSNCRY
jgi:hypothetical protein